MAVYFLFVKNGKIKAALVIFFALKMECFSKAARLKMSPILHMINTAAGGKGDQALVSVLLVSSYLGGEQLCEVHLFQL